MARVVVGDSHTVRRSGSATDTLFSSCEFASEPGALEREVDALNSGGQSPPQILVISNGDRRPTDERLQLLSQFFGKVFSVNLVEESTLIRALPIGLENARLNYNGRVGEYLAGLEAPRSPDRPRLVLASFHSQTNPSLREPIENLFASSRFGFAGVRWKRGEYREVLKNTCFVVSPPGGGVDCHRTWEAIYQGAVPVVLASHFPTRWSDQLPVHVVDSYEDFLELSDIDLRTLYERLVQRPIDGALMPSWITELMDSDAPRN